MTGYIAVTIRILLGALANGQRSKRRHQFVKLQAHAFAQFPRSLTEHLQAIHWISLSFHSASSSGMAEDGVR
ncbi:hypothetical protein HDK64DRAFT_4648 [Phyllosticta capitalensis]